MRSLTLISWSGALLPGVCANVFGGVLGGSGASDSIQRAIASEVACGSNSAGIAGCVTMARAATRLSRLDGAGSPGLRAAVCPGHQVVACCVGEFGFGRLGEPEK